MLSLRSPPHVENGVHLSLEKHKPVPDRPEERGEGTAGLPGPALSLSGKPARLWCPCRETEADRGSAWSEPSFSAWLCPTVISQPCSETCAGGEGQAGSGAGPGALEGNCRQVFYTACPLRRCFRAKVFKSPCWPEEASLIGGLPSGGTGVWLPSFCLGRCGTSGLQDWSPGRPPGLQHPLWPQDPSARRGQLAHSLAPHLPPWGWDRGVLSTPGHRVQQPFPLHPARSKPPHLPSCPSPALQR